MRTLYINPPSSHPSHSHPLLPASIDLSELTVQSGPVRLQAGLVTEEMALSRRMAAPVLVFLLLLVATEMGPATVAEARHCLSQSHHFKGLCVSSSNCANVCRTENFPGGECKTEGATRKCFCKRIC
ncbi:hypothetical protein PVAP13_1NG338414 [Panicum virgatum]|uniref:Knottins-like domain-containing protein n=2 Tax=Panicum virgatum TaxID=38727 RepID=A0A8T0X597_PANVG|nr:hypothetical protein PVAP13_1NG338414 [Panicum virgatum]